MNKIGHCIKKEISCDFFSSTIAQYLNNLKP